VDTTFQLWNSRPMLDLPDLRAFARISDLGSISGAARSLDSPKSSVSRSLVRLEEAVGVALIERSTRHLRLTDAGLLLLRHARRILDDVGEAENAIGGLIGVPTGTLRVSVPFTFADGLLAQKLPTFLNRYPQVRLVLTVDNRMIDLQTEEIDVAIRIGPLQDSELVARRIATFELWPCASPAYLAAHGTPLTVQDLSTHRVIAHADRRSTWRFKTKNGSVQEVDISLGAVVPEPAVVKTMLIGGAGIGQLPDFHARDGIANGTLVRILPHHDAETVDAHALYTSHRSLSAKVRVFIDMLAAE
jgi:DNA-binding transcriptional LysR family regulator